MARYRKAERVNPPVKGETSMRLRTALLYTCALLGITAEGAVAQVGHSAASDSAETPGQASTSAAPLQELVVTGSLIRGTPRGGPLPVEVISADDMQKQGSPTALELIKNLPISNGVLGDTNQFDTRASGSEGSGSINLRGLGPARTLVLLNGHRITPNPFGNGGAGVVDTNMLPVAAIDRVEVLKDGAAATYGSDALTGVVNFITKRRFQGFDVGGSYKYIRGSDGDWDGHITYGASGDRFDFLASLSYQHRSELRSIDRSFSNLPYTQNPEGGWTSIGNPPDFLNIANLGAGLQRDPGCGLGSFAYNSGTSPRCAFHIVNYDNLVEHEEHVQFFSSLNFDLTPHHHFHTELLFGQTSVPTAGTSPSYPALVGPTLEALPGGLPAFATPAAGGAASPYYYVPPTNPGLIDFASRYPQYSTLTTAGALLPAALFRPLGPSGNPLFDNGPSRFSRFYTLWRVESGFNGDLGIGDLTYDINGQYSQETGKRGSYDTAVDRFELALRGLGGPNCNIFSGTPGAGGCMYFNPFSNAIQSDSITGQTNPNANPNLANGKELVGWFFQHQTTSITQRLFTLEGTIGGSTPLKLWGGPVAFAVGGQYRWNGYVSNYSNNYNTNVTPCLNSLDYGVTSCGGLRGIGSYSYLTPSTPIDLSNSVYALYGELQAPITDTLRLQLAARFEDYGGQTGSTFDPKLSVRWQVIPAFALRGSIGTTFRGPPVSELDPNPVTGFLNLAGAYRAVNYRGNPDLKPESATTYSVGGIFKLAGINATIDYWNIEINKGIVAEPATTMVSLFAGAVNGCTDPALAQLAARFVFAGGSCVSDPVSHKPDLSTLSRIDTYFVNGPTTNTSGIDIQADYRLPEKIFQGQLTVGANASYVLDYRLGPQYAAGVLVDRGYEAVGFLNYAKSAYPIPTWKGQFYAEYQHGPHNLRATVRYTDSYNDERAALLTRPGGQTGVARDLSGNLITVTSGSVIGSYLTVDLDYRVFLPWKTIMTIGIDNVFDQDPPFARLDLSYDPFTDIGLGRTVKIGFNKRF
jgi:iron complex outermembrane receptor protein